MFIILKIDYICYL